ncbi:DUF6248 family natural product biosynthesis protein [Nonomuraea sp. NPDC004354]
MTPEEARWVRDHAWTREMRRQPHMIPGTGRATYDTAQALARCECMVGVCGHCAIGQHRFCHAKTIKPRPEGWLKNRPLDYIPPTAVWQADRACRSLCPCRCPEERPAPERYEVVPLPGLDVVTLTKEAADERGRGRAHV